MYTNLNERACENLGRSIPRNTSCFPALDLGKRWIEFINDDVWTSDGWLVTAIQDDNRTVHIRKGKTAARRVLNNENTLHV